MKQLLISLLVFIATFTTALFANAQTAKVIKVKGQQAIVQFPLGTAPQVGQQLDVGNGGAMRDEGGSPIGGGSRKYTIGLGVNELFFLNNSTTDKSTTGIKLNGRFGWNNGTMEFGPIGTLEYQSSDNDTVRTMAVGGFFDYNITPNVSGRPLVYGVGADIQFGQVATKTGPLETTTTIIPLFIGGNVKWFGLSDNFAVRGDAGFEMQRSTPQSGSATSLVGAKVRAGISAYF